MLINSSKCTTSVATGVQSKRLAAQANHKLDQHHVHMGPVCTLPDFNRLHVQASMCNNQIVFRNGDIQYLVYTHTKLYCLVISGNTCMSTGPTVDVSQVGGQVVVLVFWEGS